MKASGTVEAKPSCPSCEVTRQRVPFGAAVAVLLAALAASAATVPARQIDPRLEPLRPLLGRTWQGTLASPDGRRSSLVVRRFDLMAGGRVVRVTKENRDLDSRGEGFVYWDDVARTLRLFFIEDGGVYLDGTVTAEGSVITFQGIMTWPDPPPNPGVKQRFEFRNTFEALSDTTMRDSWFQNAFGPWRPGHVIEFEAVSGGG